MRKGMTLLELLVVIAIIAVVLGLSLAAVQRAREASQMLGSQNNLRQIAIGFQNLGSTRNETLPSCSYVSGGYQDTSFIELLPYLDHSAWYYLRVNGGLTTEDYRWPVSTYINPLDASYGTWNQELVSTLSPINPALMSVSSYALNAQFWARRSPNMNHMTDGTSQTIWLAEHYGYNCNGTTFLYSLSFSSTWQPEQPPTFAQSMKRGRPAPGDYCPVTTGSPPISSTPGGLTFQVRPQVSDCDPRLPNASSLRGLQVCMGDGSVRLLNPSIKSTVFWGLVTPNGGEVIGDY